jgi:hypothetical protein
MCVFTRPRNNTWMRLPLCAKVLAKKGLTQMWCLIFSLVSSWFYPLHAAQLYITDHDSVIQEIYWILFLQCRGVFVVLYLRQTSDLGQSWVLLRSISHAKCSGYEAHYFTTLLLLMLLLKNQFKSVITRLLWKAEYIYKTHVFLMQFSLWF